MMIMIIMIIIMISLGCQRAVAIAINSDVCIADQLYAQCSMHFIIILIIITVLSIIIIILFVK